jgi:hypothetical protein
MEIKKDLRSKIVLTDEVKKNGLYGKSSKNDFFPHSLVLYDLRSSLLLLSLKASSRGFKEKIAAV